MHRIEAVRAVAWVTATAVATAVLVAAGAAGAAATSCVPSPSPEQVVTGSPGYDGAPYLEAGDYAVIGRVTAVNRLPQPTPSPSPGGITPQYEVLVAALAYFAGPSRGRDLRFTVPDLGHFGYPFQQGRTYFIPVTDEGGLNMISLCTAVAALPDTGPTLTQETDRLIAAATAKGVPAARFNPRATTSAARGLTARSEPDGISLGPVALVAAVTLAAGGAGTLLVRPRRRGGSTPAGSGRA